MKVNVAVMFGGQSVEHEVSIISALQAIEALDKNKYSVIPIYISKESEFYSDKSLLDIEAYKDLNALTKNTPQVYLYKEKNNAYVSPIKQKLFGSKPQLIDIVIPVMHGTNGEDGKLQGYLEMLNVPYAGSDTTASAIGQDKVIMKHVFANSGLPIVDWFWFYGHLFDNHKQVFIEQANKLGYPVVIKPANLGSSIGISIVHNDEDFVRGVKEAIEFDEKIVVEKGVENLREVNCSVLGDIYNLDVSVIEEVGGSDEFLSFNEKYLQNAKGSKSQGMASTKRDIPANLSKELEEEVYSLSKKVVTVLGSSGVCRIDFLIDAKTNKLYINEINSMPGSLAFYLWKEKGVSFTEIMDNLVKQAIDRQRRKGQMTFTYDSNILSNYSAGGSKGKLKI